MSPTKRTTKAKRAAPKLRRTAKPAAPSKWTAEIRDVNVVWYNVSDLERAKKFYGETLGLPVAMVGQISLLVGLVLQLDRLWRDNRTAADKLDSVDEQLHELKTTTTLLGTTQASAGAKFYSHFAGGAGPQLLLADLKSQLDLLAMKISQENR